MIEPNQSQKTKFSLNIDLVPLRSAITHFHPKNIPGDLAAAVNVALLAFPQGMAYALIAGIPLYYGIFGSAVAAIIGSFFSKSHYITLGPTNATSVLLLSAFAALEIGDAQKIQLIPLIVAMAGIFLIIGSFARVASLIQYISKSVVTGYITAAAILIITNQSKNVLGIQFPDGTTGSTFVQVLWNTLEFIETIDVHSIFVAGITAFIFFVLNRFLPKLPNVAITLCLVSIIVVALEGSGLAVAKLDPVSIGEWKFTPPHLDFHQMRLLLGTAMAISILSLLEGTSIGKSLAARSGGNLHANQEMFNMGMANIGCALFSGMPASGSLTRSMLNWKSGAKSPLSSLFTGLLIILAAFLLGPYIVYVPKASLAVLVITIGLSLINKHHIYIVTQATGSDKAVFYITLIGGLLMPLDVAIYLGTGLSIFLFLKKAARPELVEYHFNDEGQLAARKENKRNVFEISIVHVEGDLFFGSADLFRDQIRRVFEDENLNILVLRMKNAYILDATCVMAMEELINYMREKDRHLLVSGVRPKIMHVLKRSGIYKKIGDENVFEENPDNPTLSTALAMKRAQEILGGKEASITIYVNPASHKEKN